MTHSNWRIRAVLALLVSLASFGCAKTAVTTAGFGSDASLKIPWDTLAENLNQIDKRRPVVLYCRKGVRSESAYETLMGKGYSLVWIMQGGLETWIAAGYPTVVD